MAAAPPFLLLDAVSIIKVIDLVGSDGLELISQNPHRHFIYTSTVFREITGHHREVFSSWVSKNKSRVFSYEIDIDSLRVFSGNPNLDIGNGTNAGDWSIKYYLSDPDGSFLNAPRGFGVDVFTDDFGLWDQFDRSSKLLERPLTTVELFI